MIILLVILFQILPSIYVFAFSTRGIDFNLSKSLSLMENRTNFCFLVLFFFFFKIFQALAQNTTVSVNVGVVLDLNSPVGKMGINSINMALSDFYASHASYRTRIILHIRNSSDDDLVAAAAVLELINSVKVQAIIGPQSSMEASFVTKLGEKAHIPIISFSATSSGIQSSYYFRIAQNDTSQMKAISDLVRAFKWSEVVPITVDNEFGKGISLDLVTELGKVGARILNWVVIPSAATADHIDEELDKLKTSQFRVFIMHMLPSLGTRIFARAKELGMMDEGFAWIVTNAIANDFSAFTSSDIDNMQGVLGLKAYVPDTKPLENFRGRWQRKFQQHNSTLLNVNLNAFGLWAYDAAWSLALAVEKVNVTTFNFKSKNILAGSSNGFGKLEISENGPELVKELSSTRFTGLSGAYNLLDQQLQSSIFQVVNMNENGERGIGYWTLENGLVRNLTSKSVSTSGAVLGPIIWPGPTTSTPKGWQNPTRRKLKIIVPVKKGFLEFVNASTDPVTNTTTFGGYSIDVFNTVMKSLPLSVPYEFYPLAINNYVDLVYQMFLGEYDAAVGDITIRADRSLYVDFTLPYMQSGISMVVPRTDHNVSKNTWVFLKPFTLQLWVISGCFFIFIGFVIWVLEHRINEDFRGPPSQQMGTSLWYSFSIMVFAHRERVLSNMARFVVITWCFVVLILTQSYTASFSSILTVQHLQKNVTNINQLLKQGKNVGYQSGSFVFKTLKQLGFQDDKLRAYSSTAELDKLLQLGTENNGISAAFDETPYLKLLLATYCSKYTMVEPTFKPDAFAFAFRKDSLLTRDVSAVIERTDFTKIEEKWFDKRAVCPKSDSVDSSNNLILTIESFWGLFIVAGVISSLALFIFVAMFLYEHMHTLKSLDRKTTFGERLGVMWRIYDQRDPVPHTFDRSGQQDTVPSAVESSPKTSSPRPSSAKHIESHFHQLHFGTVHPADFSRQEIEDVIED